MEVYWDEDGIKEALRKYSDKELKQIGVMDNNKDSAEIYYEDIDKSIKDMHGYEKFFTAEDGTICSHGESYFKVEKKSGFHKYYIAKVKGELTHTLDRPGTLSISCKSIFEKIASSHDHLSLSFSDIFIKRGIILQSRFQQSLVENYHSKNGVIFDHTLVGVVKVNFFPVPSFENVMYFFDLPNGKLVPTAYANFNY